jgi:hypothetical protein
MSSETPEQRLQRLIQGLLTPDELVLISGKLFNHGGEVLFTLQADRLEVRYLAPAPCASEQEERRSRAISRLRRRRSCRSLLARIERREVVLEEVGATHGEV